MIVWQGHIALAVGVDGGCLNIFSLVYIFLFLSPSLGFALGVVKVTDGAGLR